MLPLWLGGRGIGVGARERPSFQILRIESLGPTDADARLAKATLPRPRGYEVGSAKSVHDWLQEVIDVATA